MTTKSMAIIVGSLILSAGLMAEVDAQERGSDEENRKEVPSGETRYGWKWLAERFDRDANGIVTKQEFLGKVPVFERLDRDWSGALTSDDFDWKSNGTLGRQQDTTFALFKAIDQSSDGRISAAEWQAAFERLATDKEYLNDEELERLIYLPLVRKNQRQRQGRAKFMEFRAEADQRSKSTPKLGELAPDFELATPDGQKKLRLSESRKGKPVVLVFGSFT